MFSILYWHEEEEGIPVAHIPALEKREAWCPGSPLSLGRYLGRGRFGTIHRTFSTHDLLAVQSDSISATPSAAGEKS
jgi:hypothetical protein